MMNFRKNQNNEKQTPKEKKPRVYKANPRKRVVIALWVLLGLSFSFAICFGLLFGHVEETKAFEDFSVAWFQHVITP